MPPTMGHLSLLRKRKWEMAYFFCRCTQSTAIARDAHGAHTARRLSSKRANTASPRALDPPHAGEGREVGGRRKNPPPFGEKSPCFGKNIPIFAGGKGEKRQKMHFSFM